MFLRCIKNLAVCFFSLLLPLAVEAGQHILPTPAGCWKVSEVKQNPLAVYLAEIVCPAPLPVADMPEGATKVDIYKDGILWRQHKLPATSVALLPDMPKPAEIKLDKKKHKAAIAEAEAMVARIKGSDALKGARRRFQQLNSKPSATADIDQNQLPIDNQYRIYIAVSSSMPLPTLKEYASQSAAGGGRVAMVMRGFVGGAGKLGPTIQFYKKIFGFTNEAAKIKGGMVIHYKTFRRAGLHSVPAIVVTKGGNIDNPRAGCGFIRGDVPVMYALRKVKENGFETGSGCKDAGMIGTQYGIAEADFEEEVMARVAKADIKPPINKNTKATAAPSIPPLPQATEVRKYEVNEGGKWQGDDIEVPCGAARYGIGKAAKDLTARCVAAYGKNYEGKWVTLYPKGYKFSGDDYKTMPPLRLAFINSNRSEEVDWAARQEWIGDVSVKIITTGRGWQAAAKRLNRDKIYLADKWQIERLQLKATPATVLIRGITAFVTEHPPGVDKDLRP